MSIRPYFSYIRQKIVQNVRCYTHFAYICTVLLKGDVMEVVDIRGLKLLDHRSCRFDPCHPHNPNLSNMTDKDRKLAEEILEKYGFIHPYNKNLNPGQQTYLDSIEKAMQEYAEAYHTAKMQEVMDEKLSAADEKWIIEIIEKTNAFAKQLIKDHFNRHKVYSRPECPFQYCDNPEDCKKQNKCHYSDGEIKHKEA